MTQEEKIAKLEEMLELDGGSLKPDMNLKDIPDVALPLLAEDGLLVLEHGKDYNFSAHPRFVEHRNYGSVNFSFFQ